MNVSSCYNCSGIDRAFYAEENGFNLVKCSGCGLVYMADRPDDTEIAQAHKQGIHSGRKELNVTGHFRPGKIPRYLKILADLYPEQLSGRTTWLDVGCGHGEFIAAIEQYGGNHMTVCGTEPNVSKQASARKRGLKVDYFDLETHSDTYDVISLLNVYSHLPNPPAFLELLKRHLNPSGELVIETGDTAEFSAEDHYRPFYLPDHFSFASEGILTDLLEQLGFEIVSVKKYPFLSLAPRVLFKELVKVGLPQYQSTIPYYRHWKRYAQTDMFIRARLNAFVEDPK